MKYPLLPEIAAIRADSRQQAADIADDCPHRVRQLYEDIRHAFAGVTLGSGIGLWQAQGLDDYADDDACMRYRERDEKEDWSRISAAELNRCNSSLSFFDAEGMRFHLPAFLLADLRGDYDHGMVFVLTHKTDYNLGRFFILSPEQRHAVRSFLTFIAHEPDYGLERTEILRALDGFWAAP